MKTLTNYNSASGLIQKIFVIASAIVFLYACKKEAATAGTVDCSGAQKSFAADVNPLVQTSCSMDSDCHGSGSHSGPGPLLTYTQIANASSLIRSAVASGVMPLDASLTASEKNTILCWIDDGAANN